MAAIESISEQFVRQVVTRLDANKRVRRTLPLGGRIHIDRQLPFLCVYRKPMRRPDAGTDRLITGQPAYLTTSAAKSLAPGLSLLLRDTVQSMAQAFGRVLLVEVWSGLGVEGPPPAEGLLPPPAFSILTTDHDTLSGTLDTLEAELNRITVQHMRPEVSRLHPARPAPARFPPLLTDADARQLDCSRIGIVVRPLYRHSETGDILPLVHQAMIRDFNRALQRTFFAFALAQTQYHPPHYHMLGRRATVKAVWSIDKQLADIDDNFDFLLQVTPVNTDAAWSRFRRSRFERTPLFRYRPHTVDPALLKRRLWNIHIERVEDPTLQHLFREKQKELDIQISMLGSINKPDFLPGSLQLYGYLAADLITTADDLLRRISPYSRERTGQHDLNAAAFAERARATIAHYQQTMPGFAADVQIQSGVVGLMVSSGNLLVGHNVRIPASRAEALLAHEVGVHILTYFNGQSQPFHLLRSGLAGYEELQEGLAVLAEYLVGGLSKPRLRLLAARVIAAQSLIDGATFIDTFRLLRDQYGFPARPAFNLTMRIYRAGGLTKDAVYLRGLLRLLTYLRGNPLDELFFVGKIALDHVPIIQELQRRQVLHAPDLRPHFLNGSTADPRLAYLTQGPSVLDLSEGKKL